MPTWAQMLGASQLFVGYRQIAAIAMVSYLDKQQFYTNKVSVAGRLALDK